MGPLLPFSRGDFVKFQGIVLAGGKSSRFREDKALAVVNGMRMIEKAIRLLEELNLDPVVITNVMRDYSFLRCRIERDLVPNKGPLGGIYTACRLFARHSLLVLTCDMPGMTPPVLRRLIENHDGTLQQATIFRAPNHKIQPFPGMYESDLAAFIFSKICGGRLSMRDFLKGIPKLKVLESYFPRQVFSNVNEKKDLCQKR